jgi:hypothetical protein
MATASAVAAGGPQSYHTVIGASIYRQKYNFSSSILLLQVMPAIPWKMSPPFGHPWTKKKEAMAV